MLATQDSELLQYHSSSSTPLRLAVMTLLVGQHFSHPRLRVYGKLCHLAHHLQLGQGQTDLMPYKPSKTTTLLVLFLLMQYNWKNQRFGPLMSVKVL